MKNISYKICRENHNAFYFQKLFGKSCRFWDNVEKYCTAGQATGDNMTNARW